MVSIPIVYLILVILLVIILTSIVTIFVYRYKFLKFQQEQSSTCDEYAFENHYLKGQIYGEQETLKKFTLSYDPFIEIKDGLFTKTAVSGYQLQIYFNGLPIGDPTRRVLRTEEKFKEENLKYLIEQVNGVLQTIVEIATPAGIPVKLAQNTLISKSTKK